MCMCARACVCVCVCACFANPFPNCPFNQSIDRNRLAPKFQTARALIASDVGRITSVTYQLTRADHLKFARPTRNFRIDPRVSGVCVCVCSCVCVCLCVYVCMHMFVLCPVHDEGQCFTCCVRMCLSAPPLASGHPVLDGCWLAYRWRPVHGLWCPCHGLHRLSGWSDPLGVGRSIAGRVTTADR
jgi:hypothetical protein